MKLKNEYVRLEPSRRLYKLDTPVIGLTGGIASGKSTVSRMLKEKGFSIVDADQLVKDIYTLPETMEFIENNFPEVIIDGEINFPKLRQKVFSNGPSKEKIENFIYPRLFNAFESAYKKLHNPQVLIYDVPLLFERNLEIYFDLIVLVYASRKIQTSRLMKRDGQSEEMAKNILNQQMDIEEKKLKSEFIIDNSKTKADLAQEVNKFLRQILQH